MKKIKKTPSAWQSMPHRARQHQSKGCTFAALERITARKDEAYRRYKAAHDHFMTCVISGPNDPYLVLFEENIIKPLSKRHSMLFEVWLACYYR